MTTVCPSRRRHLLGLEPIFEGGWLHKGRRARRWDVEDELVALSLLGDVTVDLVNTKSQPRELTVHAYALGRDVDVYVAPGTAVELAGRADHRHVSNLTPPVAEEHRTHLVRIVGHTFLGDVTVRVSPTTPDSHLVNLS
jgi:hypothetical protein